jgi:mRNA interferase MazF
VASMVGGGRLATRIARGDIRLFTFAHPDKKRPVVVLTRENAIAYLTAVTVAPVTSSMRGVPSQVILTEQDGMKTCCAVNLHNLITVPQQSLGKRVGRLTPRRMKEICAALSFAVGCHDGEIS